MRLLSLSQLETISGGEFLDAVTCLGGIAGYAVLFTCTGGGAIGVAAALGIICDWTASGLAVGIGCAKWIGSMCKKER